MTNWLDPPPHQGDFRKVPSSAPYIHEEKERQQMADFLFNRLRFPFRGAWEVQNWMHPSATACRVQSRRASVCAKAHLWSRHIKKIPSPAKPVRPPPRSTHPCIGIHAHKHTPTSSGDVTTTLAGWQAPHEAAARRGRCPVPPHSTTTKSQYRSFRSGRSTTKNCRRTTSNVPCSQAGVRGECVSRGTGGTPWTSGPDEDILLALQTLA